MTISSSKPTLVFVPGMSCIGHLVWAPLITSLKTRGFEEPQLIVINNPSVDCISTKTNLKPTALDADIANLRTTLSKLIDEEEREVVLVAHSYGGTPSLYACDGFWKHQRAAANKAGGVMQIGLLASSLTLPGGSVVEDRQKWQLNNTQAQDGMKVEMIDGQLILLPDGLDQIFFNDISDADFKQAALRPAALGCAMSPTSTNVSPSDWRISYLVLTELDLAMPTAFQYHLIENGRKAGAEVLVSELRSGHFAQVSHAEEVADWVQTLL